MLRDVPFKVCIIISAFIHTVIIYPWPFFLRLISKPEISFPKIELTYFKEGPIKDALVKEIEPITSVKRGTGKKNLKMANLKDLEINLKDTSESEIEQKIDTLKESASRIFKNNNRNEKAVTDETASTDGAIHDNYFLKVRDKIKSILEKNAKSFMREGDVYVRFIINRDGVLKNLTLYKSTGKDVRPLETIAIESIKQASPFPPFDVKMKEAELPFNLPIRFTLR